MRARALTREDSNQWPVVGDRRRSIRLSDLDTEHRPLTTAGSPALIAESHLRFLVQDERPDEAE